MIYIGVYRGDKEVVAVCRGAKEIWRRQEDVFCGFRGKAGSESWIQVNDKVYKIEPDENGLFWLPFTDKVTQLSLRCGPKSPSWMTTNHITELTINADITGLTTFSCCFELNDKLRSLDMSGCDISGVTNFSYMFVDCPNLTSLRLKGLGRDADYSGMFFTVLNLDHASNVYCFITNIYDRRSAGLADANIYNWDMKQNPFNTVQQATAAQAKGYFWNDGSLEGGGAV